MQPTATGTSCRLWLGIAGLDCLGVRMRVDSGIKRGLPFGLGSFRKLYKLFRVSFACGRPGEFLRPQGPSGDLIGPFVSGNSPVALLKMRLRLCRPNLLGSFQVWSFCRACAGGTGCWRMAEPRDPGGQADALNAAGHECLKAATWRPPRRVSRSPGNRLPGRRPAADGRAAQQPGTPASQAQET